MTEPEKTPLDPWKDTIDRAKTDKAWDGYDSSIQATVSAYNDKLRSARGFKALSWKLIKAMVWTESGGPTNAAWKTRPMQIGNPGDPGLAALLSGKEGGDLIMPASFASSLTVQTASTQPEKNIQAGTGYFLMRAATYSFVTVEGAGDAAYDYVIKPGDNFSVIAAREQTTVGELQKLNPLVRVLQVGKTLKIRKAKIQKTITGFQTLDSASAARLYNTGDTKYADKLDYCLTIIGN